MTRRHIFGFAIGLLFFLAINLLSAHLRSDCGLLAVFERDVCADDIARAGWPFAFYERGGFDYRFEFNLPILLIEFTIGIIFGSVLSWWMARRQK